MIVNNRDLRHPAHLARDHQVAISHPGLIARAVAHPDHAFALVGLVRIGASFEEREGGIERKSLGTQIALDQAADVELVVVAWGIKINVVSDDDIVGSAVEVLAGMRPDDDVVAVACLLGG